MGSLPLFTSCSLALQDGSTSSNPIALDGPGQNCLDQALTTFEQFFAATATEAEVSAAWHCTSEALILFKTHVRGQNDGQYTAVELRSFIERYFLTNRKISDALLTEMMRLKQAVLGGGLEHLSRAELDQADVVLKSMRTETVKLVPYMRLLMLKTDPNDLRDRPEFVEDGIRQLVLSSATLGSLMGLSRAPYKLAGAEKLVREFGKLTAEKSGWVGPTSFVDYLPTVAALKAFFIRPNGDAIEPGEWSDLVSQAGRLFSLYLRYKYLIGDRPLDSGEGLRQITTLAKDFFIVADGSVRAKQGEVIRFTEIDGLLEQMYKLGLPDLPMSENIAKFLARNVLEKICSPAKNGRRYRVDGISLGSLDYIKKDFFGWAEMQEAWDRMSGPLTQLTIDQVRARLKALKFAYTDTAEEMAHLVEKPFPLAFTSTGTVIFEPAAAFRYDQETWTSLNWKRLFIRVALRGYAHDFESERFIGLLKPNFKEFYDDLSPFATELGFLDPRNSKIWDSTFDEANVFMFSADGDDRLSFAEAAEVLSFAMSGSKMSRPTYRDQRDNCINLDADIFGLPMIDVNCYRSRMRAQFAKYYHWLPGWASAVGGLSNERYSEYQIALENATRIAGFADVPMESSDIDKTSMIFQYIESLFVRFDRDHSETFSVAESELAFPIIRNLLSQVSGMEKDSDLLALFTYIINYGESPDISFWTKIKFLWWKANKKSWKYEADRVRILQVIANLSTAKD